MNETNLRECLDQEKITGYCLKVETFLEKLAIKTMITRFKFGVFMIEAKPKLKRNWTLFV